MGANCALSQCKFVLLKIESKNFWPCDALFNPRSTKIVHIAGHDREAVFQRCSSERWNRGTIFVWHVQ